MVRLATDALAVACILAGGAAGAAITLAALEDGGEVHVTRSVGSSHAVVSVERGACVAVRAPRVVVTTPGDVGPKEVRVRASTAVHAPCPPAEPASLEEARRRVEEARLRIDGSRERIEASRAGIEAARARIEATRERLDGERRDR